MLRYTGTTYGKVTISQKHSDGEHKYTIDIREANCLCAFIHVRKATEEELKKHPDGKYIHTLYSFLADEKHAKNIMKDNGGKLLWDKVVKIDLNMAYKESWTLLKYFVKSGYKVKCYEKTPKKNHK